MLSPEFWADELKSMPEHAPEVIFDVSLKDSLRSVNFGYLEYQFYALNTLNIPREYVSKLSIFITDNALDQSPDTQGRFYWNDKGPEFYDKFEMEILLPKIDDKRLTSVRATDTLIHETQHFADYINNVYPYRTSKIGSLCTRAAYRLTPWEKSAYKATEDFRQNPANAGLNIISAS